MPFLERVFQYIYICPMMLLMVSCCSLQGDQMRPISSSVASGGSLALAFKALSWWDRADPWVHCHSLCSAAFDTKSFDWLAFALGLVAGAILCALLELLFAVRACVVAVLHRGGLPQSPARVEKPLYKLL